MTLPQPTPGPLPVDRPRRLRRSAAMRSLVREHTLRPADLVLPMFVREGAAEPRPIGSMPGVSSTRWTPWSAPPSRRSRTASAG